jgi:hypothetical protein
MGGKSLSARSVGQTFPGLAHDSRMEGDNVVLRWQAPLCSIVPTPLIVAQLLTRWPKCRAKRLPRMQAP